MSTSLLYLFWKILETSTYFSCLYSSSFITWTVPVLWLCLLFLLLPPLYPFPYYSPRPDHSRESSIAMEFRTEMETWEWEPEISLASIPCVFGVEFLASLLCDAFSFFLGLHVWQSWRDPHQATPIQCFQVHAETGMAAVACTLWLGSRNSLLCSMDTDCRSPVKFLR